MTEQEIQNLLEKQKGEMQKEFDAKLEKAKGEIQTQAKADAEKEFKAKLDSQGDQIRELELKNRKEKIADRLGSLKKDGKIPKVWENRLKAVFEYLPDEAAHTYANDKGEKVQESVADTLWGMLENSGLNLFQSFTRKDPVEVGDETFSDTFAELDKRARAHMKETGEKSLQKAYSAVLKADPALAKEYDKKVTGRSIQ